MYYYTDDAAHCQHLFEKKFWTGKIPAHPFRSAQKSLRRVVLLLVEIVVHLAELHRPLQALFYGANPSCVSILYTKIRGPCHFQYAFSTLLVQLRPVLSAQWSC